MTAEPTAIPLLLFRESSLLQMCHSYRYLYPDHPLDYLKLLHVHALLDIFLNELDPITSVCSASTKLLQASSAD